MGIHYIPDSAVIHFLTVERQESSARRANGKGDACDNSDGDGIVDRDVNCLIAPNDDQSDTVGSFYSYLVRGASGAGEGPAGNATAGPRHQENSGTCA